VRSDWFGQRYPGARLPGTSRQASRRSPARTRGRRASWSRCLDPEIAGRHVLAVRSAVSHRYHAMTKLGVWSRHDLPFDSW